MRGEYIGCGGGASKYSNSITSCIIRRSTQERHLQECAKWYTFSNILTFLWTDVDWSSGKSNADFTLINNHYVNTIASIHPEADFDYSSLRGISKIKFRSIQLNRVIKCFYWMNLSRQIRVLSYVRSFSSFWLCDLSLMIDNHPRGITWT